MQGMTLRQGDCLKLMRDIPDDSVDMIFSDPPYGTTACDWDVPIDWAAWWKEARRITKKNAPILLFSQMPFTAELVMTNRKDFRYEWIVEKGMATGFLNASRMPLKCHENVLVFYRALPPYNPIMTKGTRSTRKACCFTSPIYYENTYDKPAYDSRGKRYPRDVLCGYFKSFLGKAIHPTQKTGSAGRVLHQDVFKRRGACLRCVHLNAGRILRPLRSGRNARFTSLS